LQIAGDVTGQELVRIHADYGRYVGERVTKFISENEFMPKFIASHGHTIFHQPENGFTFQLGDGETMAAFLRLPLVANFRNKDVALGGQGAPLVPVGETYLFSQYDMCLNLGGIVNISLNDLGFDIGPCNMLLNFLAEKYDEKLEYDKDGVIAQGGTVIQEMLNRLNDLSFYQQLPPKSIGKEWFEDNMLPIVVTNVSAV
jgi:anhydro-N-acetylmuramic acid kinase